MGTCFVIQPFDGGKFDKRYEDVFRPAIEAANLEPYRVDRDPSVAIPIEDIESGIRRADVCLADISADNPNVWFELGFAIAAEKQVILICSSERSERFPFDVQHRSILNYKTDSTRDFQELAASITTRIKAALAKNLELGSLAKMNAVADTQGLSQHEIVALVTAAQSMNAPDDYASSYTVRQDMNAAGFTDIAVALAIAGLVKKEMLTTQRLSDRDYNEEYIAYTVLPRGFDWLDANLDKLVLKKSASVPTNQEFKDIDFGEEDDIPF